MLNEIEKEMHDMFKFELDNFQKESIHSIKRKEDVLITAHTGSGKTVSAEYAILNSIKNGKKVIYTSPIKSLSNQKFYEFKKKFEGVSVGILTGDIKFNPDAQCLIMTTEILRNLLYNKNIKLNGLELNIELDVYTEVDAVIFDEIHYINDEHRGKVWEECIILLPNHITLVMLSATIDNPKIFCNWIKKIKKKNVNLISTNKRVVPLKHYIYLDAKNKNFQGTDEDKLLDKYSNKLIEIYSGSGGTENIKGEENKVLFKQYDYEQVYKISKNIEKYVNKSFVSKIGSLNPIIKFLQIHNLTPALFFVFSRNNCHNLADNINITLINKDEMALIEKNINYYLSLIKNNFDYKTSYQFREQKKLWLKGIAIHHSGLIPIIKEIIELLFGQGLIKVLFATETFAVGVNMPTKTVLYTGMSKYDTNHGFRNLYTHEYLQMSGRAGRRGLDKVGYVIHLPNFYELLDVNEFKNIITGSAQFLKSKFTLNYQFLLKNLLTTNTDIIPFIKNSFMEDEIQKEIEYNEKELLNMEWKEIKDQKLYDKYYYLKNPDPLIKLTKKQIKENNLRIIEIEKDINFKSKYDKYVIDYENNFNIVYIKNNINYLKKSLEESGLNTLKFLNKNRYLELKDKDINEISLNEFEKKDVSIKGIIASQINECNEILLTEIIVNKLFNNLEINEIIALLSIFTENKVDKDEKKKYHPDYINISKEFKDVLKKIMDISEELEKQSYNYSNELKYNWNINLDFIEIIMKWLEDGNIGETGIFEGTFIKMMLEIVNISNTIDNLLFISDNVSLKIKFTEIPKKILKDEVSVDSLYIYL